MKSKLLMISFFFFMGKGAFSQKTVDRTSKIDIWDLPNFQAFKGKYKANWKSLSAYEVPDWFREAKLGIWSHWNPQSVPEAGGWYARWMYVQGDRRYKHGLKNYGHPSEFGYKDLVSLWTCESWNPEAFVQMAVNAGGRYFVAMANHHDNYDSWNSKYQPWNSVNIGPKRDVISIWKDVVKKQGLPFGVSVHASPARTWGQFMPVWYGSDEKGPKKGIPYDANTSTFENGLGKPWEGLDPKDLYGFPHRKELDANQSPYANQFMWRVDDLLKYNPDLLYFDESVGVNGVVDLGVKMGLGYLAPIIAANYYNKSLEVNKGEMQVVLNMKAVGGKYNSLPTSDEAEIVAASLVKDSEKIIEGNIEPYPFQTDDAIGPWFYNKENPNYKDATWVIHTLINNVSKNGNLLLGIPQRAQGNVDPIAVKICNDIGSWLKSFGEGIYGSRPFEVYKSEHNNIYFTRNEGFVYAHLLDWPKEKTLTIQELKSEGATLGKVVKVELLGLVNEIEFEQSEKGLRIELPNNAPSYIASVLKLHHDKTWINDDDPGVRYAGWIHKVNRNRGEYNNDVYESNTKGSRCSFEFKGNSVKLVANTARNMGKMIIIIDGVFDRLVNLAEFEECGTQKVVYESEKLDYGQHTIEIVHADNKLAVIDAFIVK